MNLNPLKKEDNTDALVKALEDANNAGVTATPGANPTDASTQVASVPPAPGVNSMPTSQDLDESIIASDPQLNGGVNPLLSDTPPAPASPVVNSEPSSAPNTSTDDSSDKKDAEPEVTGAAFEDNGLPEGLSSDADAHIPKPSASSDNAASGELDDVKKDALTALRPLIEKLDLEPADKFDKYLMMLRASDDPTLIKPAYEAAVTIEGEKEKAQALLDVINEINYITANK